MFVEDSSVKFGTLLVAEIEAGRDVVFSLRLLNRILHGTARAELLAEGDVDEERAALDVPYGDHVGDYLLHIN